MVYFINTYCVIDDAQGHGEGGGTMPFTLWPAQEVVARDLTAYRLTLILKARQLGISWICCAYSLWLCLFHAGKVVIFLSKGELEATELLRRVSALYSRLPDSLKTNVPPLLKGNNSLLAWGNGSRIQSLASSKGAGRSFTASLVVMDEAAFILWANEIYTALKPTIDGGGQLIILSTANGLGNLFHLLWTRAVAKLNDFHTIFLDWRARPGRDEVWYAAQLAEATDRMQVLQEYPATPTEAFIASGRVRFAPEWTEAQSVNQIPTLPVLPLILLKLKQKAEESRRGTLYVYELPQPGRRYVLAADVAEGLETGDYDAGVVIDKETLVEMASLHGHWEPYEYGNMLDTLGKFYNNALVAPERNNHGHATIAALKRGGNANLYKAKDDKFGWLTNVQTKPLSVDALAEVLRDNLCKVRTPAALNEMQIYRVLDDGKTGSPNGYHDDFVMAWALATIIARTYHSSMPLAGRVPAQTKIAQTYHPM